MTPDLYAAWLAAGDRLQPVGAWLAGHWWWITAAVAGVFAAWAIRRCLRDANDRVAAILADFSDGPELPQPGRDVGLYLDCVAIYADSDELHRLRDAIDQHRTGDSNG